MHRRLLAATVGPLTFAVLAAVLAVGGSVAASEAVAACVSAAAALIPSGMISGGGWRRRAVEWGVLVTAAPMVLLGDATARHVVVPVLLVALAAAATLEAAPRARDPQKVALVTALSLAITAAAGIGLAGYGFAPVAIAVAIPVLAAAFVTHRLGVLPGCVAALTAAPLPLARHPELLVVPVLLAATGLLPPRPRQALAAAACRAIPLAASCGALFAALAFGGGMAPSQLFPRALWLSFAVAAAGIICIPRLPASVVGVGWFLAAFLLGPAQSPSPGPALDLTRANPHASLPATRGGRYLLDASLANAGGLPLGTPVAEVRADSLRYTLRAGVDAAEWAHERSDVRPLVAHPLPRSPLWRVVGGGREAFWAVAGRTTAANLSAASVVIEREATLPPEVIVSVAAGPQTAMPPRDWVLPRWLLAAAAIVLLLQVWAGTWRRPAALLPWTLLFTTAVAARVPVVPLVDLLERYGVDVALAALVSAWLVAARGWLASGRVFTAGCALLAPLSLATVRLTPPMYGDEPYHLAILAALARGAGLSDAVSAGAPPGVPPLHGPFLSVLLLPGYLLAGRSGALTVLAAAAALALALVARRAGALRVSPSRVAVGVTIALTTAPLATYASQIWPEVMGALAVASGLALVAAPRRPRVVVTLVAVLAATLKARLALLTFPLAAVAWWPKRLSWRGVAAAVAGLGVAVGAALSAGWLLLGHPLGAPRTLLTLVPKDLRQPVLTAGGLLFDPSAGLFFASPLLLVALGGVALLWRRGGRGERVALLGGAATVLALLHSAEWYGGGSPPVRYLVPALPVFWLAGALLLARPPRSLTCCALAIPLAGASWWVMVTRPHLTINSGTGRYWLTDLLASRFEADVRHLVPSFLKPTTATLVVPLMLIVATTAVIMLAGARPASVRRLVRYAAACWLLGGAVLVAHLQWRHDRTVEVEDAQVVRLGGRPEPAEGTWSSYRYPSGWRAREGEGLAVPLRLPARARVLLAGWLEGEAQRGCDLEVSWDGGVAQSVPLRGAAAGLVQLPGVDAGGRHRLALRVHARQGGEVVFDRIIVEP